ncbi:MAG: SRPBCC domain-containing protein [Pseudolysinimonas sp.]
MTDGFTLVRELDATPTELFGAWTDPDELAEWLHPKGMHTPRESVSVDLRVGGSYAYTMVDRHGSEYPTGGVYREIVADQRLVFTWGEPGAEDAPVVTVSFEDLGELTRLTFDIRGLEGMPGDGGFYDGWQSALDELAEHTGQNEVLG